MKSARKKKKSRGPRRFGALRDSDVESDSDSDYCPGDTSTTLRESRRKSARSSSRVKGGVFGGHLPPEVWFIVFRKLVDLEGGALPALLTVGRVCRMWRSVSLFSGLWKEISFSRHASRVSNKVLEWLAENRFRGTRSLDLRGCNAMKVGPVSTHCDNLVALKVSTAERYLQLSMPLRHLTIAQCTSHALTRFQPELLSSVTQLSLGCAAHAAGYVPFALGRLPALERLSLTGFIVDWEDLVENCQQLKHLALSKCTLVNILFKVAGLPRLNTFQLLQADDSTWYMQTWIAGAVDSETTHLLLWLSRCQNLKDLEIAGKLVLWKYMTSFFTFHPDDVTFGGLEHLALRSTPNCVDVSPLLKAVLAGSADSLKSIEIQYLSTGNVFCSETLPALSCLDLGHCSLTPGVCLSILELCPTLSSVSFAGNYALPRGAKQTFLATDFGRLKMLLSAEAQA